MVGSYFFIRCFAFCGLRTTHDLSKTIRYMSYVWNNKVEGDSDAINILDQGIKANPARSVVTSVSCIYCLIPYCAFPCLVSSFLLNLAYIEIQEMNKNKSAVVAAFDRFLSVLRANLEAIEYRVNSDEVSPEPDSNSSESSNSLTISATRRTTANTMFKNNSSVSGDLDALLQAKDLAEWRKEYGLVWNMYMRAARRSVSRQAFRDTFAKARKDRWVPWEVYEAAGSLAIYRQHAAQFSSVLTYIYLIV